jgi:L-ribulose-5-phosphate 3-epimerase
VTNSIGVVSRLTPGADNLREVADYGLDACQLVSWDPELWTQSTARDVRAVQKATGLQISAFWAGWPGPKMWDFVDGPDTLGIVPERYREERVQALVQGGVFAEWCGLSAVITHLGFIPENATDPRFTDVVVAVRNHSRLVEHEIHDPLYKSSPNHRTNGYE